MNLYSLYDSLYYKRCVCCKGVVNMACASHKEQDPEALINSITFKGPATKDAYGHAVNGGDNQCSWGLLYFLWSRTMFYWLNSVYLHTKEITRGPQRVQCYMPLVAQRYLKLPNYHIAPVWWYAWWAQYHTDNIYCSILRLVAKQKNVKKNLCLLKCWAAIQTLSHSLGDQSETSFSVSL